jgi:O-acetyl-ADP-ribose deacetylase (regulator of RNase III)
LKAKWVIHAVGSMWQGGTRREEEMLAECYRNTMAPATARGIRSISFPAISTGAFGFPSHQAALIATREVRENSLRQHVLSDDRAGAFCLL